MNLILIAVISLGAIALVLAAILYVASKKFAVYEDPRIAQVGEVLPQANCGGCGYPGCSGFADACVKAGSLDGKFCPVGGQPVMAQIADILGLAAGEAEPMVAVVRCNGTCANRPRTNQYDGAKSCAIAASLYGGETGCSYGCLGCGDCVAACQFDAIHMNPETGLPEVDEAKCTACGACVKACPKAIIEIRPQGKKSGVLNRIESALRALPRPIIGRIEDGALLLDLRCLPAHEEAVFIAALDAFRCA